MQPELFQGHLTKWQVLLFISDTQDPVCNSANWLPSSTSERAWGRHVPCCCSRHWVSAYPLQLIAAISLVLGEGFVLSQTSSCGFSPDAFVIFSLTGWREREAVDQLSREANRFKPHHRWPHLPVPDFHCQLVWLRRWQRTVAEPKPVCL